MNDENELSIVDNIQRDATLAIEAEVAVYENYRAMYERMHPRFYIPEPELKTATLDWDYWSAMFTAGAAILLAATRTGYAFFKSAADQAGGWLATIEAGLSIFAIEGTLVLWSLRQARTEKRDTSRISNNVGKWTAVVISALAGLYQSINLKTGLSSDNGVLWLLSWALVLAMGVGATAIALISGDLLGIQFVKRDNENQKYYAAYLAEVNERDAKVRNLEIQYEQDLQAAWQSSIEYKAIFARKKLGYKPANASANERTESERSHERTNERNDAYVRSQGRNERTNGGGRSFAENGQANGDDSKNQIFKIIDRLWIENNGQMPRQSDVCRQVSIERTGAPDEFERYKSYVSKAFKEWTPPQMNEPVYEEQMVNGD